MSGTDDKYLAQRYRLWSKYDEGIKMDAESWYSVTPEPIAAHIAQHMKRSLDASGGCPHGGVVADLFCGSGGNVIQLALVFSRVIAVDIDPKKIELARHNAGVYGVADKIDFRVGEATDVLRGLKNVDAIFLSPPWGGPHYSATPYYDLRDSDPSTVTLMRLATAVVGEVAIFLPRSIRAEQVARLAPNGTCEVQSHWINDKCKACTCFYGRLARSATGESSKDKVVELKCPQKRIRY